MEVKFVEGLRVSDAETVEVAKMVLLGKINSDILTRLNRHGQPAVGLGGEDGSLFEVKPVAQSADVGFVGEITTVNVDVIVLAVGLTIVAEDNSTTTRRHARQRPRLRLRPTAEPPSRVRVGRPPRAARATCRWAPVIRPAAPLM